MIRSVSTSIVAGLIPAAFLCVGTTISQPAEAQSSMKSPDSYSMVPSAPGDHFVAGRYDNNGTYVPPHYQPVSKPKFHGYFYKRDSSGYDGMNSETTNKNKLDATPGTDQPN